MKRVSGSAKRLTVIAVAIVVVGAGLLALLCVDVGPARKVCTHCGMRMTTFVYELWGEPIWRTNRAPRATPLSRFLGPHPGRGHHWVTRPSSARVLTNPQSRIVIAATGDDVAFVRALLRRVILNPQSSLEDSLGFVVSSVLKSGQDTDWGALREWAKQRGLGIHPE